MKRLLLAAVALGALGIAAAAQVNTVPQIGLITGYLAKSTYSSAFYGLVPVSAGTDIVCIAGSASRTVRLQRLTIWGTTATAVQTLPLNLVRRASVDTGGTAATTTANPGITTQIAKRDANVTATATATLTAYTSNPTIVDTAPVYLDSQLLTMGIVTSALAAAPADFNYKEGNNLLAAPTLYGVANQICVNIAGATVTNASVWNGVVVWTEE